MNAQILKKDGEETKYVFTLSDHEFATLLSALTLSFIGMDIDRQAKAMILTLAFIAGGSSAIDRYFDTLESRGFTDTKFIGDFFKLAQAR